MYLNGFSSNALEFYDSIHTMVKGKSFYVSDFGSEPKFEFEKEGSIVSILRKARITMEVHF